jgi:vitamin B12 transporter
MLLKYKYLCHKIIFITALSAGIFVLFSQTLFSQKDSVVKEFPNVKVEDDRIFSGSAIEFSSYEVLDASEIHFNSPNSFSDVISQIPGVFIKDYGGFGGLQTISLRGTSASQTLVMLNGIKLNSSQNSIADLSKIPIDLINNIEVLRGGNSTAFGGNAVGGIINISTGKSNSILSSSIEIGSYGYKNFNINYSPDFMPFIINLSYKKSDGDYLFKSEDSDSELIKRKNADFESINGLFSFKKSNFNASVLTSINKKGVPGAVLKGNSQSENARFDEYEILSNISYKSVFDNSLLRYILTHKSNYSDYYANDNTSFVINENHRFTLNETSAKIEYTYSKNNTEFLLNGEIGNSNLVGNMLDPETDDNVYRQEISISSLLYLNDMLYDDFNIQSGLRYDYFSDAGGAFSPVLGLNYKFEKLNLISQYSYNFRVPSFNEMYYINYGNVNLEPEKAHSLNFGIDYAILNNLKISSSIFYINTENKIVSVPLSPVSWTAQNIGKVINRGLEIKLGYSWSEYLKVNFGYTLQESIDRTENSLTYNNLIPYIPQEILFTGISVVVTDYSMSFNMHYNSFTYSLPGNEIESVIENNLTFDFYFARKFIFKNNSFKIYFKTDNLFNDSYQIIKNYPMPGRQMFIGIKYEYE